jgi:excinuclease ABC subunit A
MGDEDQPLAIEVRGARVHNLRDVDVTVPLRKLVALAGVSGSGKSSLAMGVLYAEGSRRYIEALSTYTASDFSYNTGSLRCPRCEGTGQVSLDVQFLPDVDIVCPECAGSRYAPAASDYRRTTPDAPAAEGISLPELLALTVRQAVDRVHDMRRVRTRLETLVDLGLGYLTLGEATTTLSGGEAQRLKLASELDRNQTDALFVLDEPSVGLHPLDIRTLLSVIGRLTDKGATVIVIEHDLDMIANADYVIDMGPGGGAAGGTILASGTPRLLARDPRSLTARYLRDHLSATQDSPVL